MAIITTREIGATAIQIPLSNAQLDNNFINLNADIATRVPASEKGAANGVATLDASGLVPTAQLPSYVDDVLEAADFEAFPASGETGKIYVALDNNKTYRWSGSAYIYITSGAVDSVAGKTGVVTLVKADVGLANVDNTSDADKPVSTATQTALNTKQATLGYTPVNKAGDTISGDLLNTAAYSAPNSDSGVGTRLRIRGSTGTGAAGAAGGNGHVEILGGGATSAWESFAGSATRGGVLIQSGTAQGDAGNTYVAGSTLQLRAGAGTTNGTQVGFGGTVNIYAGNTARTDGNTSSGGGLTLWGGRGTQSGYFALGGGAMGFGNDFASSQSGGINSYPGTLTEGGETNISGGGYSTGSAQSYTTNTGGYIVLKGATATTGGDIAFYPGSVYEGIAGGVNGQVKVNNSIVLHAGNYSSYAQPLLVSGTTIKTINGTSVLGSGDIVISAAASGVTAFNTRSGAVTLSSSDVTEALGYTPLSNATSYLPLAGGTLSGKITLPSAIADRPQLFGGFLGMDSGDADVDIWGISRDYYPSNGTAANAWGIAWNADANQIRFIGGGNTRLSIDLDGGASGLAWDGNAVLNSSNYTDYKPPLLAPINATSTSISNWNPQSLTYQAWGQAFVNSNISADSGDVTWWLRASQYLAGGTELCMIIDGDYYAGTGQHKVLHAGNYTDYAAAASHTHNYIPINPDGDGASWTYSDENPIINGVSVGGGQRFGADGSSLEGFLQAKIVNAHNGFVNSANGYYLGNYDFGANSNTYSTNQVIDSSGNFIVGPNNATTAYGTAASGKLYFGTTAADAPDSYHITTNMSDYGGNYSKLDFKWYTGQRFYAAAIYGGFRFYDIVSGSEVFSINRGDSNARVGENIVLHAGNVGSYAITALSDTLATVTSRGASTSTLLTLTGSAASGGGATGTPSIQIQGASAYQSLEIGITGAYDGMIRTYGNDIKYYAGHWRDASTATENHSHYWYTSKIGSTDWNTPKMTLNHNADLTILGTLYAASKSFLIPHPTKPGLQLRYGSLEGPENGVYVRGKLKGTNKIQLPEYWTKLVDPDSITVTLTPVGKHQRLYVESIDSNTVTVANDGLFAGEINCFFVVYAERVDIDKLVVECE